ncbi:FimV/HubP family polar landmark protein [Marinobacter sediminum]|uniref:FimV/HubP family polar landmark protein n=1 Tax=Marinobacter sediminum TaxID=256323 RepID=UPI001939585B|nr:FimV/HubP family polar landmark protein [Marinobacter sediminum]
MKVRKLAVALALAGGLGSSVAQALGLGEIELQSYLNEPLDAEINLPQSRGVDPGDVFVNVAPESAYERVGLSRNQFLSKLRFQVVTQNDGSLAVNVSSREPLREPYLNFLLEMTWPNGRLMREYAVLVDPPVYAEDSGVQEQVSAPAVTSVQPQPTSTRSNESIRRQAQAQQSLSRGYQGNTLGPTQSSDTLWTIASRVRPNDSVSMQQVMLALQDLNPDAFIGGNINRLKRGEILRVPTLDQIQSRTRAQATRAVSQQNTEFQTPKRTVDATAPSQPQAAPESATATAAAGGDELKLLVPDEESREATEGGSAGGDGQLAGGADAGSAVAMEQLESARRENEELNTRVDDLQEQVETLQRLLELKNSQLAEMQQMAGESEEAPATDSPEGAVAVEDTAGAEGEPEAAESAITEQEQPVTEVSEAEPVGETAEGETASATEGTGEGADVEAAAAGDGSAVEAESMAEPEQAEVVEAEPVASEAAPEEAAPAPQTASQQPAADKGLLGNIFDSITNNAMYQMAVGGGLIVLLLLLLLLARRNANREKAFYQELNSEAEDDSDSIQLSLDDEEPEQAGAEDPLAEAETYVAFGRHDQAAQTLETAISREPSRTDLRLKLLGVYADSQDRASFEKQFGEIAALDDDQAMASATALRTQLDEAEAMPSIDDLESQLKSDSFGSAEPLETETAASDDNEMQLSDELLADQYDSEQEEQIENEFGELDTDFADFDLNDLESAEKSVDAGVKGSGESSEDLSEGAAEATAEEKNDDGMIEYDLSGLSLDSEEKGAAGEETSLETSLESDNDYSALEVDLEDEGSLELSESDEADDLDLELELESALDEKPETDALGGGANEEVASNEPESAESDVDSLDESFLDELDAELDKVAGEDDELGGEEMEQSSLDDLELDVSDEDLALMEEFSDSADSANHQEGETPALDDELNLEDTLAEGDVLGETEADSPEDEIAGTEELEELSSLDDLDEPESLTSDDNVELPVASETVGEDASKSAVTEIDESELGDEDDFDFLAGTDEAATKLDLARAYIEMGDSDGARDILEEVALEGDDAQKSEAQDLLKNLS